MENERHHIYLIPGFFGFSHLGGVNYFAHVRQQLTAAFRERGIPVAIHHVSTLPTSSLSRRAARLLDQIVETGGEAEGPIHLIGHSTGGLDARLLVRPGASFPTPHRKEDYVKRVRTVVSVATPHHGTPLATFFNSVLGQKLLKVLSVSTIHAIRLKALPNPGLMLLAALIAGTSRTGLLKGGILDAIYHQILKDFSEERRGQLLAFMESVGDDQTLLPQLAPEAMELFNLSAVRRKSVRYGSVVTQACRPGPKFARRILAEPAGLVTYPLYTALHRLTAPFPTWATPKISSTQSKALTEAFGKMPALEANDAIVPTLSQIRGELIHGAWADHLDILGHFRATTRQHERTDWLRTMTGFTQVDFKRVWVDVVSFMLRD